MSNDDRTENWRIFFEGFSCAGADRRSAENGSTTKEVGSVDDNNSEQESIVATATPFQKLSFDPVYNNDKMWQSHPSKQKDPNHLALLSAKDSQSIHFAKTNASEACSAVAALELKSSVIIGARFQSNAGSMEEMASGGNVHTVGKGPMIVVTC